MRSSLGIRREVVEQTVIGVDYTYRSYGNLWTNQETNQIWDPAGTRVVGFVNGTAAPSGGRHSRGCAAHLSRPGPVGTQGNPGKFDMVGFVYLSRFLTAPSATTSSLAAICSNPRLRPAVLWRDSGQRIGTTLKGAHQLRL
jgi:hypothetical protein